MKTNKKISIIIPLFNGEKFIKQTLNSILSSSYQNLEILIINDGSTDNSVNICKLLQCKDPRIKIFHKKNGGIFSARNYGVEKATGDFLCFCDQDDLINKECYMEQIKRIELDQSDICMCSVGRNLKGKLSAYEISDNACYKENEILEQLLYPLIFNGFSVPLKMDKKNRYPHIWSCMFRMSFWRKYHFLFRSYINHEDDLLLKIDSFSKATKISTISYMGYYWRVNLDSETYGHKYVQDICDKQQYCYEDMYQSLSGKISDTKTLKLFTQVTLCKQYLDSIHNLLYLSVYMNENTSDKRNRKNKRAAICAYIEETIYQRDFANCIQAKKYVKIGRIKPIIILTLLSKGWTMTSYYAEVILDYILIATLHSQTLTKLERLLKGIH